MVLGFRRPLAVLRLDGMIEDCGLAGFGNETAWVLGSMACGGVPIGSAFFSGSFASFDGGKIPMNGNGDFLFFSGDYLGEGDGVGFPFAGFLGDNLVLWPALLVVADLGWPLAIGGWLWPVAMAARVSSLLNLVLGFFFWACWSLIILGLDLVFIFYFGFCYLSFMMDDGVSASSVV